MYSQNGEEAVILGCFQTTGRFLDIGAADGITRSNTYALFEHGWSGVVVEPSPVACSALLNRYADHERISVVNALIAPKHGWMTFYEACGDGVSTVCADHRDKWKSQIHFREMRAYAVTPTDLLDLVGTSFDFLSLDVEGLNIPVLRGLLDARFEVICVEHDGAVPEIDSMLAEFKRIHLNRENAIYVRK